MDIIKNLFHLALQVDDFDKSVAFYCDKLGFDQMFELKVSDFRDILKIHDSDKNNDVKWLTYIRVAPEEYLEVFNGVINPPAFDTLKIDHEKTPVVQFFALGCENVAETIAALAEKGIVAENGFITDPTGCKIKIVHRSRRTASGKKRLFNCLAGVTVSVNDLPKMSAFLQKMGMKKAGETENSVLLLLGKDDQYIELVQSQVKVETGDEDFLGHIAIQVNGIADAVWNWGNNGIRCCIQPMLRDTPLPVMENTVGNFAVDGCEIVWVVSEEGNRFEIMYQPGNTTQQAFEREHPF